MTDKHTRVVEITADSPKVAERVIHELKKEAGNASRWGHDVSVREVDLSELDSTDTEFTTGREQ